MFINFDTILPLNASEQLTIDSYSAIKTIVKSYIDRAYKLDEYGISDKSSIIWEEGNKIFYLITYLTFANEQITKDYINCNLNTFDYYKELYKLDCIRKTFACLTIPFDVDPLYEVFGLGKNFGFDGIGYMAIVEDTTEVCNNNLVFQVNKTRI